MLGVPSSLALPAREPAAAGGVAGTSGDCSSGGGVVSSSGTVVDSAGGGTVIVSAGGGTVTVEAGGTVSLGSVCVGVVVVVVSAGVDEALFFPLKSVVSRPPPNTELPETISGTVMITAARMKPHSPVTTATCQARRRPGRELPGASPSCAMRASMSSGVSWCSSGWLADEALRTTPRTGTARVTTSTGLKSISLRSATRTGVNAAAASVPGAQMTEVTYAATAEATAVTTSVGRSILPLRDVGEALTGNAAARMTRRVSVD